MVENLYKRKLLSRNHVLTFADFTSKTEADIEDMFEPDFYLKLVNEEYSKQLSNPIALTALNFHNPRILLALEAFLAKNPMKTGTFNHFRPARYLTEHIVALTSELSATTLDLSLIHI